MITKSSKIYLAGHRGLVGSAINRCLVDHGYENIITRSHSQLDLTNQAAVEQFFASELPEVVILAAAKVGGIGANSTYGADFIMQNLLIETHVLNCCHKFGVYKVIFLGSTCIYPKSVQESGIPMVEESLLTSDLELSNEPYAIAKISGLKICEAYNKQYGTNWVSVQPTNLYGYNDNFNLETSHVLPAMIRKIHLAKLLMEGDSDAVLKDLMRDFEGVSSSEALLNKYGIQRSRVLLWGTGNPKREFLWSDDLAEAIIFILENVDADKLPSRNSHINIGTGEQISLKDLAEIIADVIGYDGEICFDHYHPDGTMQKCTDVSRIRSLGWHHKVELRDGIEKLYNHYLARV